MRPEKNRTSISRKEFLRQMAVLTSGLAAPVLLAGCGGSQSPDEGSTALQLPKRRLGDTGIDLPVLGLGGVHVGQAANEQEAGALVEAALEEGVRFIDTAEMYQDGGSERWLGAALQGIRDQVFLMTKTHAPEERSAESAKRHLAESLERLQTDRLDLWQVHGLVDEADVERTFREGGAMEYLLKQKAQGVVRHIGVTGHRRPATMLRALQFWDEGWKFDTMQFPLNPVDFHQFSFQRELLPEVVDRGIGVLAMKCTAGGKLLEQEVCTFPECLRYALSLPASIVIVGMETIEKVRSSAAMVRDEGPLSTEEVEELLARMEPQAALELEWYKQ